jgi:hypothetical protein
MKPIEFSFDERKAAQAAGRLIEHSGGEMNYLALVDYTHGLPEWREPPGPPALIPFEAILKAANVPQETIDAIAEESEAERSLEAALATVR